MNRTYFSFIVLSFFLLFTPVLGTSFASDYEEDSDHYIDEDSEKDKIKQKAKDHGENKKYCNKYTCNH